MYIYPRIHAYIYACIHVSISLYTRIYMRAYMHICACIYYLYPCMCVKTMTTYVCAGGATTSWRYAWSIYIHKYIHMCTCMCEHRCTYTYIQIHKHKPTLTECRHDDIALARSLELGAGDGVQGFDLDQSPAARAAEMMRMEKSKRSLMRKNSVRKLTQISEARQLVAKAQTCLDTLLPSVEEERPFSPSR